MATPKYEYNADSPELTSQRDSVAVKEDYVDGFSDLVAFEKNTKPVTLTTESSLTQTTSSIPLRYAVDEINNRLLMGESHTLYFTDDDGATKTIIVNYATHPTTSAWVAGFPGSANTTKSMIMLTSTTALVSYGYYSEAFVPGVPKGKIFLMTMDAGGVVTSLVEKLAFDYGTPLSIQKCPGQDYFVAGMYDLDKNDNTRVIFASFNNGEDWVEVYAPVISAGSDNNHVHKAAFVDSDTIIATCGDGPNSEFVKITRPAAWNGSDPWDVVFHKYLGTVLLADFLIDDGSVYFVVEGGEFKDGDILIYDLATDKMDSVTVVPLTTSNAVKYAYTITGGGTAGGYTFLKHAGVFYTHIGAALGSSDRAGLYSSVDGRSWSRVWASPEGPRYLNGIINNKIIITDASNSLKLGFLSIPSSRFIDAVICEKANTNNVGLYDGTTDDNWFETAGFDATVSILSTDRIYDSETGIKLTATNNGNDGRMEMKTEFSTGDVPGSPQRVQWPTAGDFITVSYDIKITGVSEVPDANKKYLDAIMSNAAAVINNGRIYPLSNGWHRYFFQTQATAGDSGRAVILSLKAFATAVYNPDVVIDIQNFQTYYDPERYDLRTYIPKDTVKADDYSVAPLAGLGASWSVTFDWLPLNGNLAFPSGIVDTLPIATIKGSDDKYIKLYWDRAAFDGAGGGMSFKLTDGTNTVSLDAELGAAMKWGIRDNLKFAITSDGTTTILYCFNPENQVVHGSVILSKSGNAVLDVPTQIALGANEDETVMGCGAFANIRGFDSVLSAGDVADVFDSVSSLLPAGGGLRNRYNSGGYRSRRTGGGR